eukprot:scaffold80_cov382-Prasinococcus_capsulatus_cf.AAC.6
MTADTNSSRSSRPHFFPFPPWVGFKLVSAGCNVYAKPPSAAGNMEADVLGANRDEDYRHSKVVVIAERFYTDGTCAFLDDASELGITVELWALENVIGSQSGETQSLKFEEAFSSELYGYANCSLKKISTEAASMAKAVKSWISGILYTQCEVQAHIVSNLYTSGIYRRFPVDSPTATWLTTCKVLLQVSRLMSETTKIRRKLSFGDKDESSIALHCENDGDMQLHVLRRVSLDSVSDSYVFGTGISLSPSTRYDMEGDDIDLLDDIEQNGKVMQALCLSLQKQDAGLLLRSFSNIENAAKLSIPNIYICLPSENGQFLHIKVDRSPLRAGPHPDDRVLTMTLRPEVSQLRRGDTNSR